jgi:hypothetical protein
MVTFLPLPNRDAYLEALAGAVKPPFPVPGSPAVLSRAEALHDGERGPEPSGDRMAPSTSAARLYPWPPRSPAPSAPMWSWPSTRLTWPG